MEEQARRDVRDAYGAALLALAVSVFVLIASASLATSFATLFAASLQVLALGLTMRVSGASRRVILAGLLVLLGIVAFGAAGAVYDGRVGGPSTLAVWLLLVLVTIVAIALRLARYRRVTLPLVLGLLCVYLLLGLSFGIVYDLADVLSPPAFSQPSIGISGAVYFSFVTLTTVGYGDIAAVSPPVRAIAVLESILGQFYLVAVVSFAVGRLGGRGRGQAEE